MANPVIRESIFTRAQADATTQTMTMNGTINKSGILLLILVCGAVLGWNLDMATGALAALVGSLVAFAVAITLVFRPMWAGALAPVYALLEGAALGFISAITEQSQRGIVGNAMILTFGVFAVMLTLYRLRILQATERFTRIVILATCGIAIVYLVDLVMMFAGTRMPFIHEASPVGIIFSLIVSGLAAMNLIIDFNFVEQGVQRQAPKWMEWYAGFSLLVTIVWLYLELLRLLTKISKK